MHTRKHNEVSQLKASVDVQQLSNDKVTHTWARLQKPNEYGEHFGPLSTGSLSYHDKEVTNFNYIRVSIQSILMIFILH